MLSNEMLLAYNQIMRNIDHKSPGGGVPASVDHLACLKCDVRFPDERLLAKHELSHNKRKHECKECGKKFNSSSDLKRHVLIHTNTRPYKCHLCPTAFVQQAHLTRHLKSHTRHGVRFKCLGCGIMFLHSTNVRWHQQFCKNAQGTNGGYVVTQSEGEGLTTPPNGMLESDEKMVYYEGGASRHNSGSSTESRSPSSGSENGCSGNSSLSNKMVYFDGPYDKSELLHRNVAKPKPSLSASQLSYLNSRVSMLAPKALKVSAPEITSPDRPASTEDLLRTLAEMQDVRIKAPSYKIVPNKIIQNNNAAPAAIPLITKREPAPQLLSFLQEGGQGDKVRPILELVKKLVAEGLQTPTADLILTAISKHLSSPPTSTAPCSPPSPKKRKISEPSQATLNQNLLTGQRLLSTGLNPLITASSSPLSFTPLQFRQFPRIAGMPSSASMFAGPNYVPTSLLATQLAELAASQPPVSNSPPHVSGLPRTSEVRKHESGDGPRVSVAAIESTERQPVTSQNDGPRVKSEPMERSSSPPLQQPSSGEGALQEQGQGKKIAFHRLQDLLSSVV